ncbi:hypothetical protein CC78DRAFT_586209 [Lojkania enalia]|uniref:Uncharacterized protein n=1 Tax=Lojkania enalia TaxID=147567 RepID=A0A9P4K0J0_9PLEO|nr:hypothetical protein CC78DRAFT_586209 [Didymosphaeria enalia]
MYVFAALAAVAVADQATVRVRVCRSPTRRPCPALTCPARLACPIWLLLLPLRLPLLLRGLPVAFPEAGATPRARFLPHPGHPNLCQQPLVLVLVLASLCNPIQTVPTHLSVFLSLHHAPPPPRRLALHRPQRTTTYIHPAQSHSDEPLPPPKRPSPPLPAPTARNQAVGSLSTKPAALKLATWSRVRRFAGPYPEPCRTVVFSSARTPSSPPTPALWLRPTERTAVVGQRSTTHYCTYFSNRIPGKQLLGTLLQLNLGA